MVDPIHLLFLKPWCAGFRAIKVHSDLRCYIGSKTGDYFLPVDETYGLFRIAASWA